MKKGIAKMGRALIQRFMIRFYADPPRNRSNLVDGIVDAHLRPHRKLAIDQDKLRFQKEVHSAKLH
jgi:hypothetical protein